MTLNTDMSTVRADKAETTETIGRELGTLIRGAKELHYLLSDHGQPVADPPALMLLYRIAEHGPMRLSSLAGCVFLDVSTVSRQVQDLEQAGWVVRERDPHDGRASLLRLTPAGEETLAAARAARLRALSLLLGDWTDEQCHALAEQLARFNEAIATFRTSAHASSEHRQENVT